MPGSKADSRLSRKKFHSLWLRRWRAPDGKVGLALASIADATLPVTITLPMRDYELTGNCQVIRVDGKSRRHLGNVSAAEPLLPLRIPPRAAWILELVPLLE